MYRVNSEGDFENVPSAYYMFTVFHKTYFFLLEKNKSIQSSPGPQSNNKIGCSSFVNWHF